MNTLKTPAQLAFNNRLVAYDWGFPLSDIPNDYKISVRSLQRSNTLAKVSSYEVPPIKPAPEELDLDAADHVCIWVGMLPSADKVPQRTPEQKAKGKTANNIAKSKSAHIVVPPDPRALRVVTPLGAKIASYFALINPGDDGICETMKVEVKHVFFFPRFRDDNVSDYQSRQMSWPKLVRQLSNPQARPVVPAKRVLQEEQSKIDDSSTEDDGGSHSRKRTRTTQASLTDAAAQTAYIPIKDAGVQTADTPVKHAAARTSQTLIADAATQTAATSAILEQILSCTQALSNDECREVIRKLKSLMPKIVTERHITSQDLQNANRGVAAAGVTIPDEHHRAFIVDFVSRCRDEEILAGDSEALKRVALESTEHVEYMLGAA